MNTNQKYQAMKSNINYKYKKKSNFHINNFYKTIIKMIKRVCSKIVTVNPYKATK